MKITAEDFTDEFVDSIVKQGKRDVFLERYAAEEELIILRADFFRGKKVTQEMLCSILRARLASHRFTQLIGSALNDVEGYSAEFLELIADIWVDSGETPVEPPKMGTASQSTYQSVYKESKLRIVWEADEDLYLLCPLHCPAGEDEREEALH